MLKVTRSILLSTGKPFVLHRTPQVPNLVLHDAGHLLTALP